MNALRSRCVSLSLALASVLAWLPAAAQTASSADGWNFEITPYFWASAMHADVNTRLFGTRELKVPFSELASALKMAAMGAVEARKGPWGGFVDVQYVKLGARGSPVFAPFTKIDVTYQQQIWTLAGYYRVAEGTVVVDAVGGARYVYLRTDANATGVFMAAGPSLTTSEGVWDGVVGVRATYPLNAKWSLVGYADVGGGGSNLSWQMIAGANYGYSKDVTIKFGVRYFSFERDDASVTKASLGGPYLGVGFRF